MKNKSMWIIGSIAAIMFVVVLVVAFKIVFYKNGNGVYGNRLDNIENYPISEEKYESIKSILMKNSECQNVSHSLQGRIIKYFIEVSDETSVTTAQRFGDAIIDEFSETELGYYDVAIYVTSKSNEEPYPMAGYKSKTESAISWVTNKGEVENEE